MIKRIQEMKTINGNDLQAPFTNKMYSALNEIFNIEQQQCYQVFEEYMQLARD